MVISSEVLAAGWISKKNKEVLSLDLKTDRELLMIEMSVAASSRQMVQKTHIVETQLGAHFITKALAFRSIKILHNVMWSTSKCFLCTH